MEELCIREIVRTIIQQELLSKSDAYWKQLWKGYAITYSNGMKRIARALDNDNLTDSEKLEVIRNHVTDALKEKSEFNKGVNLILKP